MDGDDLHVGEISYVPALGVEQRAGNIPALGLGQHVRRGASPASQFDEIRHGSLLSG